MANNQDNKSKRAHNLNTILITPQGGRKQKANWLGNKKKILRQYFVSLWSYITYPFKRKRIVATQKYFSNIYNGKIQDDLIFDGNSGGYYDKIKALQLSKKKYSTIFDCGCGIGFLYRFLNDSKIITFDNYIGIDFAVQEDQELADNAKIIKSNICDYDFSNVNNGLIVLCNVICYLSNDELNTIIQKAQQSICDILVLDPLPGLFWDATFDKVKLHYRSFKKMNSLMATYNYTNTMVVKDYLWNIGKCYFTPLSYAALYTYKDFLLN